MKRFFKKTFVKQNSEDEKTLENIDRIEEILRENKHYVILDFVYQFLIEISKQRIVIQLNKWEEKISGDYQISYFLSDSSIWIIVQDEKTKSILANLRYSIEEKSFSELKIKTDQGIVNKKDLNNTQIMKKIKNEIEEIVGNIGNEKYMFIIRNDFEVPNFLKSSVLEKKKEARIKNEKEIEVIKLLEDKKIGLKLKIEYWEEKYDKEKEG